MFISEIVSNSLRPPSHFCRAPLQSLLLSTLTLALSAAPMPPSSAPSVVPFRFLKGFAVIVPVYLNGSGPFDLVLDTGSSCTTIDRELARSLQLPSQGEGTVTTIVRNSVTSETEARTVSIGPVTESSIKMTVRDLDGLHQLDPQIRGLLGQDVLKHADYLLDYEHHQIVFDSDRRLLSSLCGERTPVVRVSAVNNPDDSMFVLRTDIVDRTVQPRNFLLDSGSAWLMLFTDRATFNPTQSLGVLQDDGGQQLAVGLLSVQLRLGGRSWEVPAHTIIFPAQVSGFDSILPTSLFTRLYISESGSFVIVNPRRRRFPANPSPPQAFLQTNIPEGCNRASKTWEFNLAKDAAKALD